MTVLQVTVTSLVVSDSTTAWRKRTINCADCEAQPALFVTIELEQDGQIGNCRHDDG